MVFIFEQNETVAAENMDFETYLREFEGQHAEFYDGKVILMSPASSIHNKIIRFLIGMFDTYLLETGEGEFRHENVTMRLLVDGKIHAPEPDIFVVTTPNLEKLTDTYLDGAADLVIEVISPESEARDRGKKFILYEKAGVKEYWIIDAIRHETLFYTLNENNLYHLQRPDVDGLYQCQVLPRLRLPAALLSQESPPSVAVGVELVKKMLNPPA